MPAYRRVLLVLLLIGVLVAGFHAQILESWRSLFPAEVRIAVVDPAGRPIPLTGTVDVFALDRSLYMSSPMPRLGTIELDAPDGTMLFVGEGYPRSVQLRFHVPGFGVDYVSVEQGRSHTYRLRLGPPVSVGGTVTGPDERPLPGVRVVALGGNSRGVELAEAVTDVDGRYVLDGLSSLADYVTLRVLAGGFTLQEREHWFHAAPGEEVSKTSFQLVPAPPVRGQVELPPGIDATKLRISVMNLAAISAPVDAEGRFVLHHLASGRRYRLLVRGLPDGLTNREIYAEPGQRVTVPVVRSVTLRGTVVSERFERPIAKVEIWHPNSTRGNRGCVSDGDGKFELQGVPIGDVRLNFVVPAEYFGGGALTRTVKVESRHRTEPVVVRIR